MTSPQIEWDWGTAYDLFVSLDVLHNPAEYGVRAAWTAGMRARLSPGERATLEDGVLLVGLPLHWIYTLPEPKDVEAALWTLGQIPPEGRLPALARFPHDSQEVADLLQAVAARGHWREEDRRALRTAHLCSPKVDQPLSPEDIVTILDHWSDPGEFGQRYLPALRSYQEVFFAEEEARIVPALREAVGRAQALAAQMALPELVEELSQGLRLADLPADARVVLAPSYWCTPLLGMNTLDDGRRIYLFGARPADASLVPGEVVPDALLRSLKALSDPTRLRILSYLKEEALGPAELSRRLRLRLPTVTHHLQTLRLAGLVQFTLDETEDVKRYAVRAGAVDAACEALKDFLE